MPRMRAKDCSRGDPRPYGVGMTLFVLLFSCAAEPVYVCDCGPMQSTIACTDEEPLDVQRLEEDQQALCDASGGDCDCDCWLE